MAAIEKLLAGAFCTLKTAVSMQGVAAVPLDPTLKDPAILNRITMENEIFKAHWAWINNKFLPDDSPATGFPPPQVSLSSLLSPSSLGTLGQLVPTLLSLFPATKPIAAVAGSVMDALGVPATAPAPAPAK